MKNKLHISVLIIVVLFVVIVFEIIGGKRVQIGEELKGQYVPGGCFEDNPTELVKEALRSQAEKKGVVFLELGDATNSRKFEATTWGEANLWELWPTRSMLRAMRSRPRALRQNWNTKGGN